MHDNDVRNRSVSGSTLSNNDKLTGPNTGSLSEK